MLARYVASTRLGHSFVRRRFARNYYKTNLSLIRAWSKLWTENANFYYKLSPKNRMELVSMASVVVGVTIEEAEKYLIELDLNDSLRNHIAAAWAGNPKMRDAQVAYGRREGWYVFIRAMKPRVVVETGVHDGVGACVIAAALMENSKEGFLGRYFGTDIDSEAGSLFTAPFNEVGEILYGDSILSLTKMNGMIDLFINDSDHSAEYERAEYRAISNKLAANSLVLGDNSHLTSELNIWARSRSRPYLLFREEPINHWYPGAGIGISPSSIPLL